MNERGAFSINAISAMEPFIDWRDENGVVLPPETGQVRSIGVCGLYKFAESDVFWTVYRTENTSFFNDVIWLVQCRLLEKHIVSTNDAEIRMCVLGVYCMEDALSGKVPGIAPILSHEREAHREFHYLTQREWDNRSWISEEWDALADWGDRNYIYTDAQGIDHCLAITQWSPHTKRTYFMNHVLGSHLSRKAQMRKHLMRSAVSLGNGQLWVSKTHYKFVFLDCVSKASRLSLEQEAIYSVFFGFYSHHVSIWDDSFHSETLREVLLPKGIDCIGENAFSRCPNLESIIFPDNCYIKPESIAPNAFDGCSRNLTFSIPEGMDQLIARFERFGFRVEKRAEGSSINVDSFPKLSFDIDTKVYRPMMPVEALYPEFDDSDDVFYESDLYREGWSKLEKPNRNRKQRR